MNKLGDDYLRERLCFPKRNVDLATDHAHVKIEEICLSLMRIVSTRRIPLRVGLSSSIGFQEILAQLQKSHAPHSPSLKPVGAKLINAKCSESHLDSVWRSALKTSESTLDMILV